MGSKRKGIMITYISGATKVVYLSEIKKGRSIDPRTYMNNDKTNKALIKSVEEGEF